MQEQVYIIIPVYNRKQITLSCLDNLRKSGDLERYHVVIIDDGSTDGTAEAINKQYPSVNVLPGDGNLWWTGAMALGMQYAYEQGAEYFIWLNDDCTPATNTLSGMVNFMQSHPGTIVAPICYAGEPGNTVQIRGGVKGRKTNFLVEPGEVIEVDATSGRCLGIPKAVFQKISVPDRHKFPHYYGDDMYILKATRSGFKAYLLGDYKAFMYGGAFETFDFQQYFSPNLSPIKTLKAIFWQNKSPYRLPSQFFYLTEKYSLFLGTVLFTYRMTSWLLRWIYFQFILSKNMQIE